MESTELLRVDHMDGYVMGFVEEITGEDYSRGVMLNMKYDYSSHLEEAVLRKQIQKSFSLRPPCIR